MSQENNYGNLRKCLAIPVAWIVIGLAISFASLPFRFVGSSFADPRPVQQLVEAPQQQSRLRLHLIPENPSASETSVIAELVRQPPLTDEPEAVNINASASWIGLETSKINFVGRESTLTFPLNLSSEAALKAATLPENQQRSARIYATSTRYGTATAQLTWGDSGKNGPTRIFERLFTHAADALALAGVVILTGCCLVFFHQERARSTETGTEGRTPLALRLACLLSITMALPSSVSNAISSSAPFWSCITLSLLLIAFVIVCGYRFGSWCQNFSNNFRQQPIFRVIALLTAAGALGGLAFHLVTNQSRIEFPSITYLGLSASKSSTLLTASRPGVAENSAYPQFDKYPLLARDQSEAYDKSQMSKEPVFIAIITAIFAGVLGDILIGIIAANAVHLLVSGLMYQDNVTDSGKDDENEKNRYDRYLTRQNLTVISLGILAGFAGPKLLPQWADDMFEKKIENTKMNLENQIQASSQKIEKLEENASNTKNITPPITKEDLELEGGKLITEVIRPFASFADNGSRFSERIRAFGNKSDQVAYSFGPQTEIVRTFDRLFFKSNTETYEKLSKDENTSIDLMPPTSHKSLRRLLLARFQLQNRDFSGAKRSLEEILKNQEAQDYRSIAKLHLIWLDVPLGTLDMLPEEVSAAGPSDESSKALFDHIRITRALLLAPNKPDFSLSSDDPPSDAVKKSVDTAFNATALYLTDRWKVNQDLRKLGPVDIYPQWDEREKQVAEVVRELCKLINQDGVAKANDETPKVPAYLNQLMNNKEKNWDKETASEKSQQILKFLPPEK